MNDNRGNKNIYNRLFEKYKLIPEECLFIDDKKENVKGAEAIGMYGLRFLSSEQLIEDLRRLTILM